MGSLLKKKRGYGQNYFNGMMESLEENCMIRAKIWSSCWGLDRRRLAFATPVYCEEGKVRFKSSRVSRV